MQPAAANSSSILSASNSSTLGFGFTGSGFLLFFFIGVTSVLRELGVVNNSTKLAGNSGGSIISAAECAGTTVSQQLQAMRNVARICRPSIGCRGFLDSVLHKYLQTLLPASSDASELCTGRLYVGVTDAQPEGKPDSPLLLGSNWTDTQQLITALRASSYIPVQAGRAAALKLPWLPGSVSGYDGGFTISIPCPPGVTYCVKVSSRAMSDPPAAEPSISTDSSLNRTSALPWTNTTVPSAAAVAVLSMDAAVQLLNALLNITRGDADTGPFLPLNPILPIDQSPDIYPGLSGHLLMPASSWDAYSLFIPDDTTLHYMFNVGRMDAAYWAVRNRLASAVQAIRTLNATAVVDW